MEDQYSKAYIRELAHKWRVGMLTDEERHNLEAWDKSHADEILKLEAGSDPNEILNRMLSTVFADHSVQNIPAVKLMRIWPRIAVAVAVAFMVMGVYFFRSSFTKTDDKHTALVTADVAPGKNGATLTLANGQKIRLSDVGNGELAQEAGVVITKSADGQLVYEVKDKGADDDKINTLSTAKGETYKVRLPDGSLVYLNAASSLTYAASLNERGKRVVRLIGEGFFEIAKDKAHPFVVKTDNQEVEVLGTHFNVNAYSDEPVVSTTLLEGSVKLVAGNADRVLKPGQVAMNGGDGIKVSVANVEAVTDWKNEEFFLDKMDFRMAMRKLARWYNIEVIYSGSVPDNLEAGGWIPRSSKLSDVLKAIESSGLAKFKIEGRKVYVSK